MVPVLHHLCCWAGGDAFLAVLWIAGRSPEAGGVPEELDADGELSPEAGGVPDELDDDDGEDGVVVPFLLGDDAGRVTAVGLEVAVEVL